VPSTLGIVASSIFTPADLAPDLWLDAADTTTITESGGSVSQWNDLSGNGRHLTQGTGALQPTTGASTVNGFNVLDFAGDYLTSTVTNDWKFMHDGTLWFYAAVWQAGVVADPNAQYGLLGTNIQTASIGAGIIFDDLTANGYDRRFAMVVARGVAGSPQSAILQPQVSNGTHPANTPVVFSANFDPSNATTANKIRAQVNGGTVIGSATTTGSVSSSNPTNPLQVGAAGNDFFPLTGKIAEIVIVSGTNATAANRELVRDYLNSKWGVY
jgi:hypothetical protein